MHSFAFLNEYQKQVETGLYLGKHDPLSHCALGLSGEAGEVADMIKKSQYADPRAYAWQDMALELGDVLWYTTALCNLHKLNLAGVLQSNIAKLAERHHGKGTYSVERLYSA